MSDPREAVEQAIKNRLLIEQQDKVEAHRREQLKLMAKQDTTPKQTSPRTMGGPIFGPKRGIVLNDLADQAYSEANFPSQATIQEAIETYGISNARQRFKPKTMAEAKARLTLVVVEPIIGAAQEVTAGVGLLIPQFVKDDKGIITTQRKVNLIPSSSRPATAALRIGGALAIPSPADFVAGFILQKTTIAPRGRNLLNKIKLWLVEKGDPLMGADDVISKMVRSTDTSILNADDSYELKQLLKLDRVPNSVEFERGMNKFRDATSVMDKYAIDPVDFNPLQTQVRKTIDILDEAFKKAVSTDDPRIAKRAWEQGKTQAQRLSVAKIGKVKKPLLDFSLDFSPGAFEKGTETEIRRNYKALTDLKTFANKNELNAERVTNFIAYEIEHPQTAGAASLSEGLLAFQKLEYKFDMEPGELINFIKGNPTYFDDGALLSVLLSEMSQKNAQLVIEGVTDLPPSLASDAAEIYRSGLKSLPSDIQTQEQKPDLDQEEDQNIIFDMPTPPIEETTPVEEITPIVETPPIEETTPIERGKPDQGPVPVPPPPKPEPTPEPEPEPTPEPEPEPTIITPVHKKDREKLKDPETHLPTKSLESYRVIHDNGTKRVRARTFKEAMLKARTPMRSKNVVIERTTK